MRKPLSAGNAKFENSSWDIDAGDFDLDFISEAILPSGPTADEGVCSLIVVVEVLGEGGEGDDALRREFDSLAEEAEFFHSGHDGGHAFADAL